MKNQILRITTAAAIVLLMSACSKVTPDNYAKVSAGMTRDEVHAILGKPDDAGGGGIGDLTLTTETWKGNKQTINVTFAGNKVALKSINGNDDK